MTANCNLFLLGSGVAVVGFGPAHHVPEGANIGFTAKTGRLADGTKATLLSPLDRPTDIERVGDKTYYVLNFGDGTLLKLNY